MTTVEFGKNNEKDNSFIEKLVNVNRVAKVVKGGRRFSFSALVVVGDGKGRIGFGTGKANEVPQAVNKALNKAKSSMIHVPMRDGRTLHHDIIGNFGAGKVIMRAAKPGTGVIAGGAMRAVFETMGVQDVVCKSLGSSNPYNLVRAAFDAFVYSSSPKEVALRRGKTIKEIADRRNIHSHGVVEEEV